MEDIFGPINIILILAMILGLVQLLKKVGVSGNWLLLASMAMGIILGVLFQLAAMYPAVSIWLKIAVYGLLLGLTASGLYDIGKQYTTPK